MIEGENHAKIHDEWQAQTERAHIVPRFEVPEGLSEDERLERLRQGIEIQKAAAQKADRIRGMHEAYKLGNITPAVFLAAMREEAGDGR